MACWLRHAVRRCPNREACGGPAAHRAQLAVTEHQLPLSWEGRGGEALRGVGESDRSARGRWDALMVADFALDLGRLERFRTDQFNDQRPSGLCLDRTYAACHNAALTPE